MFHSPSYRSPIASPRDKYLAALAEAKAAEAEYLAAERLQQEEASLRHRLEQIQLLKHHNAPGSFDTPLSSHYPAYQQPLGHVYGHELELLRQQIAAEERARIAREQEEAREREALRMQWLRDLEAQRKSEQQARELAALRRAQVAREQERSRALEAQRARLAVSVQRATQPAVRVVIGDDSAVQPVPRRHHCRQYGPRPELNCGAAKPQQQASVDANELLQVLLGAQNHHHKVRFVHSRKASDPKQSAQDVKHIDLQELLNKAFGPEVQQPAVVPPSTGKSSTQTSESPVSLEQLITDLLGAAGVKVVQPSTSSAPKDTSIKPSETKEAAPSHPAPATPLAPTPAPQPSRVPAPTSSAPAPQTPHAAGWEQLFNHFHNAAAAQTSGPQQVDLPQLLNMFFGSGTRPQPAQAESSKASSSKSSTESTLKQELETRLRSEESNEDQDLAEAIRMSLADLDAANAAATPTDPKGKAPAPAPLKDVATSAAEVKAVDASFTDLSNEFVFPEKLDFSTSRTSSPARHGFGASEAESVISRLSYNALNQPVRYYHQALSGLLARLDAVDSFGDEEVRHARKEVVGRVEGALDEVEGVIETRWRKFVGKPERTEENKVPEVPAPVKPEAEVEAAPAESEPVEAPADSDVALVETTDIPVAEPTPTTESKLESSHPPAAADPAPSYSPASVDSPLADTNSESVETVRPSDDARAPESPAASDMDTFLLPAISSEQPSNAKKSVVLEEDGGSDWSEVDA